MPTDAQSAAKTHHLRGSSSFILHHPSFFPVVLASLRNFLSQCKKIGLDAADQMSYSRPLTDSRIDPRGWVCIWDFRDDGNSADREALGRSHGCKRRASDLSTSARPSGPRESTGGESWGASNRSRNSVVSSAPLGHSFSGGFFLRKKSRPAVAPRPDAATDRDSRTSSSLENVPHRASWRSRSRLFQSP